MTGKLAKGTILRNELKMNRYANDIDCHIKLRRGLTRKLSIENQSPMDKLGNKPKRKDSTEKTIHN